MLRWPDGQPDRSQRPDGRPDFRRDQNEKIRSPIWSPGAIWSSDEAYTFFKRPWYLPKRQQLNANLVSILVTWSHLVAQELSGHPGGIWSPIRSPEHLVVNLVVVDAFSLSTTKSHNRSCQSKSSTDGFLTCERVVESSWAALFISPIKTKSLFKKNCSGKIQAIFDRLDWNWVPFIMSCTKDSLLSVA